MNNTDLTCHFTSVNESLTRGLGKVGLSVGCHPAGAGQPLA